MESSPSSSDQHARLEQIVAYLDGELSAEESAHVERQLASDEHYRQELQSIDRAWAALDQLPAAAVDDGFCKTTMELVIKDARREVQERTQALPIQRRRRNLTAAMMLCTCGLLGLLAFRLIWRNPNRPLLADLSVIQYVDLYTQFKDPGFLRALDEELGAPPWDSQVSADVLEKHVEQFQRVGAAETREDWLNRLEPEEKSALRAKFNRFHGLSQEERLRLRELHQQVADAADEARIATLVQYHLWLKGLAPTEQYELRQEPTALDRANRVARMLEEKRREAALQLSEDQLRDLIATVRRHVKQGYWKRDAEMSERGRALRNGNPEQLLGFIFRNMRQNDMEKLLKDISNTLPAAARQQLQEMDTRDRHNQIWNWLRQARVLTTPQGRRGEVSQQRLEDFFAEELPPETQEKLLALPREEMKEQLERMYRGVSPPSDWQDRHERRPPRHRGPHGGPPDGPRVDPRGESKRRRLLGRPQGTSLGEDRIEPGPFGPPVRDEHRPRPRRAPR